MKPSDKFRFNFDWENSEDTSRDVNPLYNNPHEAALLFGRGLRAGIDRKEQKKQAAVHEKELLSKMKSSAGARPARPACLRGCDGEGALSSVLPPPQILPSDDNIPSAGQIGPFAERRRTVPRSLVSVAGEVLRTWGRRLREPRLRMQLAR